MRQAATSSFLKPAEIVQLCARFLHGYSNNCDMKDSPLTDHDHFFLQCSICCWANTVRVVAEGQSQDVLLPSLRLLTTETTSALISQVVLATSNPPYYFKATSCSLSPLHICATLGLVSLAKLLLEPDEIPRREAALETSYNTAVGSGLDFSHWGILDINSRDAEERTPLIRAARYDHQSMVRLLLEKKADVNSQDFEGVTALSWASAQGLSNVVQQLLSCDGVRVDLLDQELRSPLVWSARKGKLQTMNLLLEYGKPAINRKDMKGRTALSFAAERGHFSIVQRLLAIDRIAADEPDDRRMTPLIYAARKGYSDIVKLLLDTGKVQVNARCKVGRSSLAWAARHGKLDTVKTFLDHEYFVDINSKDDDGQTPLMLAVTGRLKKLPGLEAVKLLVDKGADINVQDNAGRTALWIAEVHGAKDIADLLVETGRIDINICVKQFLSGIVQ
jgi:ankyrin repeat protein